MANYFCTKNMWDNCSYRDVNDGCANDAINCSYRVAISRFREKDIVLSRDFLDMSRITQIVHEKNTRQK